MTDDTTAPAYLAADVRAAEAPLLAAGEPLMMRAAAALTAVARAHLAERPGRVLVLAGAGDNGGDALYAAAELAADDIGVDVVLTSDRAHRAALGEALLRGAQLMPATLPGIPEHPPALVIDGILGIGASPDARLRGTARAVVETLIHLVIGAGVPVIAVDLPSGLHPDTGEADGIVLPAVETVTFGAVKAGLARGRGSDVAGRIRLVDLGLPIAGVAPAIDAVEIAARQRA